MQHGDQLEVKLYHDYNFMTYFSVGQDAEDILIEADDLEENARLQQAEADAVSTDIKIKLRPQLQQLDLDGEDSLNAAQEMSRSCFIYFMANKVLFS